MNWAASGSHIAAAGAREREDDLSRLVASLHASHICGGGAVGTIGVLWRDRREAGS